jgi:hypothetical protein
MMGIRELIPKKARYAFEKEVMQYFQAEKRFDAWR